MEVFEYGGHLWLVTGDYIQQADGNTRNDERFSDMLDRHMKKYSKVWKKLAKL